MVVSHVIVFKEGMILASVNVVRNVAARETGVVSPETSGKMR
jgi:hypothetical protein